MAMQGIPDIIPITVSDFASRAEGRGRISPPRDDGRQAWRRDHQYEVPPVPHTVGQQGQEHVAHAPGQADDGAGERSVLRVDPLNAWVKP